jgi:hypothetical protein
MPRRRYEDDDDYLPEPPRRSNPGLVVGLVVGGAVLALVAVGGLAVLFFARASAVRDEAVAARDAEAKRVGLGDEEAARRGRELAREKAAPAMTRSEFEKAVRGKTQAEIIAAVGRPDDTRENVPGETLRGAGPLGGNITFNYNWWVFRNRVMNEATGKPYATVAIRFGHDGKADRFDYP